MPRVAQNPRPSGGRSVSSSLAASPFKSPVKIPLNDDAHEKAQRLQSRHALHDIHMNQIKAAASPMRKVSSQLDRAGSASPASNHSRTPRRTLDMGKENELDDDLIVGGSAVTPMKRVPILANFEEWMKMATDNKINATNSWNFALIDYFHDMSLLKEGDGVNFQKASCTLDGCVKIYTSRVDSVATETGKLLSGLADSNSSKKQRESEADEESEEDVEGEDGVVQRKPKKKQRSAESTLVSSFAQLQLKKFELEFSVDPLFKKASADFDEGGAKGLLLNHLSIDGEGRIVFDSSDDANDVEEDKEPAEPEEEVEIDVTSLGAKFFPDLDVLDEQDVCPSLKTFEIGDSSGTMDIPFLKAAEDWRQEHTDGSVFGGESSLDAGGFDDDGLDGLDLPPETGFGEGGEAWAKDAAIEPRLRVHVTDENEDDLRAGSFDPDSGEYVVSLSHEKEVGQEDIMQYFDEALQKNWAGPEHWRIRKIKDSNKPATTKTRKEKEPFEIDFVSPLAPALAETIYTPASSQAVISLPKKDWKSKTRNLLPDDKHFNSKQLLRLFLKPKARMGRRVERSLGAGQQRADDVPEGEMDEAFWAQKEAPLAAEEPKGAYDADFFQDDALPMMGMDDDDDLEFADARDHFSPALEGDAPGLAAMLGGDAAAPAEDGAFGTTLVTHSRRLRPEYVQYARVAKKVDVRRLKEELWRGMALEEPADKSSAMQPPPTPPRDDDTPLKFTSVMQNLQNVYAKPAMDEISTSFCFICLLHLANEKGLAIENEEGLTELSIRKDYTAVITAGGE